MNQLTALLLPDLREMLREGSLEELKEALREFHPADVSDFLRHCDKTEQAKLFGTLGGRHRTSTFEHLDESHQLSLMHSLGRSSMLEVLVEMSSDERAAFARRLPEHTVDEMMPLLAQAERDDLRKLLQYKEGTAGSIMTTEYATFSPEMTVGDALESLRKIAPGKEMIDYIYVIDGNHRLLGVVSLRTLVMSRHDQRIRDVMRSRLVHVRVEQPKEEAAWTIQKYDLLAVPVVDPNDRLVGAITHDDILDVLVERASEDIQRVGAVAPVGERYLSVPFWSLVLKRTGWLVLLLLCGTISVNAMQSYTGDNTLPAATLLALLLFVPMVIATGGNSGTQSATLIIRSLALREVRLRDWWRVLLRELQIGLVLGLLLAPIGFARALLGGQSPVVGCGVAAALILIVLTGTIIGASLPLIFRRMGLDPALASSPFVSVLVDLLGIVIYFNICTSLLRHTV